MFCYFTGCISHLSLIIILKKISGSIQLETVTGLEDTLQNSYSKSWLHQLKYDCTSVAGYRPLNKMSSLVFFKDFDHTVSLTLC